MKRSIIRILSVVFLLSAARVEAAVVLVPPALNAGDPYHLIFVSSTRSDANFGGIAGADTIVQGLANAASIGVSQGISWRALLSDSTTSAISRFNPPSAPIYDLQGNRIAVNGAALWNAATVPLENSIAVDETGGGIFIEVWTGTTAAGTLALAPSNWTGASSSVNATSGLANVTNGMWMNAIGTAENVPQSIYAFSSQLIAPAPIPEPSISALGAFGLLWLCLFARRRRGGEIPRP